MKVRSILIFLVLPALLFAVVHAQDGPDRKAIRERILERFDEDGDGRLNTQERMRLREFVQKRRESQGEGRSPGGGASSLGRMAEPEPETLTNLYGQNAPELALTQKNFELADPDREKVLQFRATFPTESQGRLPIIVWSHGLYGSQDFYDPLVNHWAQHGYLVLQPTHSDSLRRGSGLTNPTSDWASRPKDVTFLLDSVKSHPVLSARADLSRVGMGGHSYGAHTTLLISGAETRIGGPFADPRPRAFLAISPQGADRLLTDSSWAGLKRPTLFISGDNDKGRKGDPPSWRLEPFKGSPAGEKYLLWVKDAHHNFGGISGARHSKSGPPNGDQVALVKSATLAFWDKYLKSKPEAARLIDSGSYNDSSQGLGKWSER